MAKQQRESRFRPGYLILSIMIAAVLWGIAHGSSSTDQGFDLPVSFQGVPEDLVITDQNADEVNVRLLGSRAAIRNLPASQFEYPIDVSGAKAGPAVYELSRSSLQESLDLPPRVRLVSRSPSAIRVQFERRGRKSVRVRPDLMGEPAEGFEVTQIVVDPPRVWLSGARSDVLRLAEVVTETVDISGIRESAEREVGLSLGGGHVWMEQDEPVVVRVQVAALPPPEPEPGSAESAEAEEVEG